MIAYVTIGTSNLERSTAFYDTLLAELGATRLYSTDSLAAWGLGKDTPILCVTLPFDGKQAMAGNGVMIALRVESPRVVDAIYAKAIELGANDEGPPGPRGDRFYAGYFRDLDGNKLNVHVTGAASSNR
jgi:predicted lactoylglutathione lyase